MRELLFVWCLVISQAAYANDWEKFYRPYDGTEIMLPSTTAPEAIPTSGNVDKDVEAMWSKGFAPIGYTDFNTSNNKTDDAIRFAKKLKARYVIIGASLTSSSTVSVPITLPNNTTSYTGGSVSASGSGGYANGQYSGTTTTYGTQTTYIPMTVNRFEKTAIYFKELPKIGLGIMPRPLTPQEVAALETRRAVAVRFVRDGSPAYHADILPGDIIVKVNGQPADGETLRTVIGGPQPIAIQLIRNSQTRVMSLNIPPEWQPK